MELIAIKEKAIIIKRFRKGAVESKWEESFWVPVEERTTVLQALQYIYEKLDPTLAFEYSCRYNRCGLCGVEVNGRPRLACVTFLEDDETTIAPLSNLPVIRDLVVDRDPCEKLLQEQRIFYSGEAIDEENDCAEMKERHYFKPVQVDPDLEMLLRCFECFSCHAICPKLDPAGVDLNSFAGPLVFLKLAQLHLDPRDQKDRKAQARELGIEQCSDCRKCTCPRGIPLYRKAIKTLLS